MNVSSKRILSRITAAVTVFLFSVNMVFVPVSFAQVAFLPAAGTMVNMTPKFDPMMVKGIKLYPDNPFKFDFIVDTGDLPLSTDEIKDEGQKLASYFLASLTTPEKEVWVNLSPYEKSRIIPSVFGDTQMGRELLSEDYILKQIMATALYPERQLGKEFWQRVYAQASRQFGTTNVPVSTFNKVWIVPDEAVVYENAQLNSVFVVQSRLKVMLEKDYLAANKSKALEQYEMSEDSLRSHAAGDAVSSMSSQIIKQIVIPALEKEVNEGKNFAGLRQVYQSFILAAWYKKNLRDNVLSQGYVDRHKILGVDNDDKQITEKIYRQYLKAYRKGVYNYIKEEVDPATQEIIPRKYFSGGVQFGAGLDLAEASDIQVKKFGTDMAMRAGIKRLLSLGVFLFAAGLVSVGANAAPYTNFLDQVGKGVVSVEANGQTIHVTPQNFKSASLNLQVGNVVVDGNSRHTVVASDRFIGMSGIVANMVTAPAPTAASPAPVPAVNLPAPAATPAGAVHISPDNLPLVVSKEIKFVFPSPAENLDNLRHLFPPVTGESFSPDRPTAQDQFVTITLNSDAYNHWLAGPGKSDPYLLQGWISPGSTRVAPPLAAAPPQVNVPEAPMPATSILPQGISDQLQNLKASAGNLKMYLDKYTGNYSQDLQYFNTQQESYTKWAQTLAPYYHKGAGVDDRVNDINAVLALLHTAISKGTQVAASPGPPPTNQLNISNVNWRAIVSANAVAVTPSVLQAAVPGNNLTFIAVLKDGVNPQDVIIELRAAFFVGSGATWESFTRQGISTGGSQVNSDTGAIRIRFYNRDAVETALDHLKAAGQLRTVAQLFEIPGVVTTQPAPSRPAAGPPAPAASIVPASIAQNLPGLEKSLVDAKHYIEAGRGHYDLQALRALLKGYEQWLPQLQPYAQDSKVAEDIGTINTVLSDLHAAVSSIATVQPIAARLPVPQAAPLVNPVSPTVGIPESVVPEPPIAPGYHPNLAFSNKLKIWVNEVQADLDKMYPGENLQILVSEGFTMTGHVSDSDHHKHLAFDAHLFQNGMDVTSQRPDVRAAIERLFAAKPGAWVEPEQRMVGSSGEAYGTGGRSFHVSDRSGGELVYDGMPVRTRLARNDHAMAVYGGIDLEKLVLNTQGSGRVRTAFSDPRILQMLLEAQGLLAQVQTIRPVSISMVNTLIPNHS